MKNLFILAAFVLALQTVTAQKTIEKNINHTNQVIDLDVKFAHKIVVKTWNKSTVYFKAELSTEGGKYLDLYELDVKAQLTESRSSFLQNLDHLGHAKGGNYSIKLSLTNKCYDRRDTNRASKI